MRETGVAPQVSSDFQDLCHRRRALVELLRLSHFDDDPWWHVEVEGALPLRERVRAPSKVVLLHAAYRAGLDRLKVTPEGR